MAEITVTNMKKPNHSWWDWKEEKTEKSGLDSKNMYQIDSIMQVSVK